VHMPTRLSLFPSLLLLALAASFGWADAHVLLVGIEQYSASESLRRQGIHAPNLKSSPNDLALVEQTGRHLFAGSGALKLTTLRDAQATWDGVIGWLDDAAAKARPADTVLVYFTLHGALVRHRSGPPTRALLLFDQELPGPALRDRFDRLPARDKALVVDACFAGSVLRAPPTIDEPVAKSVVIEKTDASSLPESTFFAGDLGEAESGTRSAATSAGYAVLAACPETEEAYSAPFGAGAKAGQSKWYSAFTLALCRSLLVQPPAPEQLQSRLRQVTEQLLRPLGLRQQPLALGVAKGRLVHAPSLVAARAAGSDRWTIPVGLASAVGPGTVFRAPGKQGASLQVREADWLTCRAAATGSRTFPARGEVEVDPTTLVPLAPTRRGPKSVVGFDESGQPVEGTKWALVIGINDYLSMPQLLFCRADALAYRDVLTSPAVGFEPEHVRLMVDDAKDLTDRPIRSSLLNAFEVWLAQPKPQDLVWVIFTGHGMEIDGKSFLLPQDAQADNRNDTWIALSEVQRLLEACPARRKILFLDMCHSGGRGVEEMGAATAQQVRRAEGMVTIASCDVDQKSHEWFEQGHGVFSYYALDALRHPKATDADRDGYLSIDELYDQVFVNVAAWAAKYGGKQQAPIKSGRVKGKIVVAKVGPEEVTRFGVCEAVMNQFPLPKPATLGEQPLYEDVPTDSPHYPAVMALTRAGLVRPLEESKFCGERALSRYEWAFLLAGLVAYLHSECDWRFLPTEREELFPDVPKDHWAFSAVRRLGAVVALPDRTGFEGSRPLLQCELDRDLARLLQFRDTSLGAGLGRPSRATAPLR